MSTYQVATKNLGIVNAETFMDSASNNSAYYVFAAKHGLNSSDLIPTPADSTTSLTQAYSDMIFGKKITDTNLSMMINRYNWESNVVFDMYEDSDTDLKTKKYYALVEEGELYKVYKCLFNNNGGPSIVEPSGTDTDILEIPIDGYIWKYMYSFDLFNALRFMTDTHIPVVEDLAVKQAAIPGSIDVVKINYGGAGYNNYTVGSFRNASDLSIGQDARQYGLDESAVLIDNYYKNCLIKITSGNAAGQYRTIVDYKILQGRRIATLDSVFSEVVSTTDTYEIYPRVYFTEVSGNVTTQCMARAIIGGTSNTVTRIEVLNPGAGYRAAKAELRPDQSVGLNTNFLAELTPIMPPPGGHGSDVKSELGGNYVGISTSFIGDNSPLTVRGTADYSTIGILKDPLYANVRIYIDSTETAGQFTRFEDAYKFKQIKLAGSVNFNSANTIVFSTDPDAVRSLRSGDEILIKSESERFKSRVDTIIDQTTFTIQDQPALQQSNGSLYLVESQYFGQIRDIQLDYLDLTNVNVKEFSDSDYILGGTSFAYSKIDGSVNDYLLINNRAGDSFSGFNQLTKLYGDFTSQSVFELDETVTQTPITENSTTGKVYNFENNVEVNRDVIYLSNVSNTFVTVSEGGTGEIVGNTSSFVSQYKYNGDLIPDSGEILYLENVNPINRSTTRSETIKLILRF